MNHSILNMVNVPRHYWNMLHSTFIIFIEHCQIMWVGKCLSYWLAKPWDCLLRYWPPMKNILFLIETIQWDQFRCNYLRNKKLFSELLAEFLKCSLSFRYFERKYDPHRFCISKITASENVVGEMPKKFYFRGPSEKQSGKGAQALLKSASQNLYQI